MWGVTSCEDEEPLPPGAQDPVFRPWARRRIRLAGLAAGPLAAAGFGMAVHAVSGPTLPIDAAGPGPAPLWALRATGALALLCCAWLVSRRLLREVHRGARITFFGLLLAGLPLAPAAGRVALLTGLAVIGLGPVTAGGLLAADLSLLGVLALLGAIGGPLAWAFVGAMSARLPDALRRDEAALARYRASTRPRGRA